MHLKRIIRRALALALCAAALAGLGEWPALAPTAEALDVTIDASSFIDPNDTKTTCYIYYWHKGIPPRDWNFRDLEREGKEPPSFPKYPTLLTWDGKYYLYIDEDFAATFDDRLVNEEFLDRFASGKFVATAASLGVPHSYSQFFEMNKNGLLANCSIYQKLRETGMAVCLEEDIANLPYLTPASLWGRNQYLLGVPVVEDTLLDPNQYAKLSGFSGSAYWGEDYVNWLVSQVDLWAYGNTSWLSCGFGVLHGSAEKITAYDYTYMPLNQLLLKYYSSKLAKAMADQKSYFSKHFSLWNIADNRFNRESFTWDFVHISSNPTTVHDYDPVIISAYHSVLELMIGHTKCWSDKEVAAAKGYDDCQLAHNKSKFIVTADKEYQAKQTSEYRFDVYYAEPVIASIMKTSFTVEKGQVVNLDGPIVIDPGCVVTVKDGGVLSCAGWVLNRGQIMVEPGGTVIVQELENDTSSAAYGCITTTGSDPDSPYGRIACDGKMIIMRDCKVCAGGLYGLKFGEGAQVVNYGQIISENLSCKTDHTIENRGDTSAVFAGWGVTGLGYELTQEQITGQDYPGKGTLQETAAVILPKDAVYGEGASRLYVNSARSVTYSQPKPEKGYVSGFVAPLPEPEPEESYIPQELPANYIVMRDPRYDVNFIEVEDVIYHYDGVVGRWVNIREDGTSRIFDYAYGGTLSDTSALLPDGYILSDGRVVNSADKIPPSGIQYDVHEHVYWIEEAEDSDSGVPYYYWEEALERWVYVDLLNKYHLADEELGPPPNMSSDYISSEIYGDVPAGFRRYTAGMAESNGETLDYDPNEKPKVQYDPDTYPYYYIYYDAGDGSGVQQYWYNKDGSVFMLIGTYGFTGTPVDLSKVDLNGHTLP